MMDSEDVVGKPYNCTAHGLLFFMVIKASASETDMASHRAIHSSHQLLPAYIGIVSSSAMPSGVHP